MVGKHRITKPTLGVILETGLAVIVPVWQVVEVLIMPIPGDRTIDVIWDGKKLMMFVSDLGYRSEPIDS